MSPPFHQITDPPSLTNQDIDSIEKKYVETIKLPTKQYGSYIGLVRHKMLTLEKSENKNKKKTNNKEEKNQEIKVL